MVVVVVVVVVAHDIPLRYCCGWVVSMTPLVVVTVVVEEGDDADAVVVVVAVVMIAHYVSSHLLVDCLGRRSMMCSIDFDGMCDESIDSDVAIHQVQAVLFAVEIVVLVVVQVYLN